MEQVDVQIQRCKRITHNLLRFSRRTQSVIETVDVNEFVEEVVELMEREARTSGIKFFTDLEENLPTLQSDPSQLQQVFLNMITNAMDAHDGIPYGTIRIHTRSAGNGHGVNIKILLVDDEVIFTHNLSKLLEVRGYEVTIANDGQTALRAFGEKKFDVIVLDLKMPGMDGIAILEEIKKLGLFTETLILTGRGPSRTNDIERFSSIALTICKISRHQIVPIPVKILVIYSYSINTYRLLLP
jgi:CheY-like chemotaxis protein